MKYAQFAPKLGGGGSGCNFKINKRFLNRKWRLDSDDSNDDERRAYELQPTWKEGDLFVRKKALRFSVGGRVDDDNCLYSVITAKWRWTRGRTTTTSRPAQEFN